MRLKIWDSYLTCQVSNKCLNVCERVQVILWIKRWFPPFPSIFLLLSLLLLPSSLIVCFVFINPFADLQWNAVDMFGLVLLIETCTFWINYGTVSLTLKSDLSLKCAHSGPNTDRYWLPVNISANIVNKQKKKMKLDVQQRLSCSCKCFRLMV